MEIEAKFRVDDPQIFRQLLALPALSGASLRPRPAPEHQRTTYFDTPDERLRARGASLRVREVGGRRVATVKRSRGGVGGLHVRDEWETPIGAEVHPRHWPPGLARDHGLTLIGPISVPLVARLTVHTRRHSIDALVDGRAVAEICLDEGYVAAGGRVVGFRELEVELCAAGSAVDFTRICAALARRFSLRPEPRGKRSRGLALLDAIAAEQTVGLALS